HRQAGGAANPLSQDSRWRAYDGGGTWGGSRMLDLRRRDFISLLGGVAAAWPLAARAQQPPLPVIGVLSIRSSDTDAPFLVSFRQGLSERDLAEGRNVAVGISLRAGPTGSAAFARSRSSSPPSGDHRHDGRRSGGAGSQGGDHRDSDRLHHGQRSGQRRA